jgi:hypothetical protein
LLGALLAAGVLLGGCGGGSPQTSGESSATYSVKVLRASFPAKQSIARPERMELVVRNTGARTVPNLAVTVDSFNYASNYPELSANKRPIWAIERGPGAIATPPVETQEISPPGGGQTAYVNTWALGPLPAGRTQRFVWLVVPVKGGTHVVRYRVEAGLAGKAKVRLVAGGTRTGLFAVKIAGAPPPMHVDPATGKVVAGPYPVPR